MNAAVRAADRVYEFVDCPDADPVAGNRHVRTLPPQIYHRIEAVDGSGVDIAVGRVVATPDDVK